MRVYQTWIIAFLLSHAIGSAKRYVYWDDSKLNITPDSEGNVKFAALADFGHVETSPHAAAMADKLHSMCENREIHFIVSTGDNFYGHVDFQEYWIDRFQINENSCKWVVLAGNSDYKNPYSKYVSGITKVRNEQNGPENFNDKWLMPSYNFIGEIYGSEYEFAFLDTVENSCDTVSIVQERDNLLRNMNSNKKYIVFGHYPILSDIQGDLGEKVDYLKEHFENNHNMLLYCASHVHALELLQSNDGYESYVQVISGAAGAFLNIKGEDSDYKVKFQGLVKGDPVHSKIKRKGSQKIPKQKEKTSSGSVHYGNSLNGFVVFNLRTYANVLDLTYITLDNGHVMKDKFHLNLNPRHGGRVNFKKLS